MYHKKCNNHYEENRFKISQELQELPKSKVIQTHNQININTIFSQVNIHRQSRMNFAYELWFFFQNQEKYFPHLCHTANTGEVSKKPNKFFFSWAHYSKLFLFTYCVDQNKRKKFLRNEFCIWIMTFFSKKKPIKIFPPTLPHCKHRRG